ncbi:hypothetical protein Taro_022419 [Colocasia esculenta]|uniref:Uncharacterized protein n=1 Tax=Colocasia esculenta TaxID=4460 RepID=A0A843V5B9_COLES|nr:hypothetical protein [Colocasia esculenta]
MKRKSHKVLQRLISALEVRLHRLLQRCHVTNYTCTPKQVVSLKTQQVTPLIPYKFVTTWITISYPHILVSHFLYTISNSHKLHFTHTHYTLFTFTLTHEHMHIVVTHSPNHQRRTQYITSHRRHLGNTMATLGLRRPGEQVSTLTSGTCPPPGFPPNALRYILIVKHIENSRIEGQNRSLFYPDELGGGLWPLIQCQRHSRWTLSIILAARDIAVNVRSVQNTDPSSKDGVNLGF